VTGQVWPAHVPQGHVVVSRRRIEIVALCLTPAEGCLILATRTVGGVTKKRARDGNGLRPPPVLFVFGFIK
jgi:hypothetical protein